LRLDRALDLGRVAANVSFSPAPPIQIGGWGCCSGFGFETASVSV
jgi:hypothetical protein